MPSRFTRPRRAGQSWSYGGSPGAGWARRSNQDAGDISCGSGWGALPPSASMASNGSHGDVGSTAELPAILATLAAVTV